MLQVQMLGRFAVLADQAEITLPTAKTRAVAAYLFWNHGKWVRRAFLGNMLWQEADAQKVSANLRQAIYSVRHALEKVGAAELLETRRDTLRMAEAPGSYTIDAMLFTRFAWEGFRAEATDVRSLARAASIYGGAFLEDLSEEWCLTESRCLSETHLIVLKELTNRLAKVGLFQAALPHALRRVELDPLDEEAHRSLMSLYLSMGQPSRAMQQFDQCRQVLKSELGIEPAEETLRLREGIAPGKEVKPVAQERRYQGFHTARPALTESFSDDPLLNARLLMLYGKNRILHDGNIEEGTKAFEKALTVYEGMDDKGQWAQAMLVIGESLLYAPGESRPDEALRYLERALEYYRSQAPSLGLSRTMALASEAYWSSARHAQAIGLAHEGINIARALNDKNSEAFFALTLSMVCVVEFRIKEAKQYIDIASNLLASFSEPSIC